VASEGSAEQNRELTLDRRLPPPKLSNMLGTGLNRSRVLQEQWDPTFSGHSYGFRPGRSAHQAVAQAQRYVAAGYGDLEHTFVGHPRGDAAMKRS
jgi:hypothetical protein